MTAGHPGSPVVRVAAAGDLHLGPHATRRWRNSFTRAATVADLLLARVLQHEVDHLDGVCVPDRITGTGGDLLWGTAERAGEFGDYVRAVRRGEPAQWEPVAPADLWQAVRGGLPVFGDLIEQERR